MVAPLWHGRAPGTHWVSARSALWAVPIQHLISRPYVLHHWKTSSRAGDVSGCDLLDEFRKLYLVQGKGSELQAGKNQVMTACSL